MWNEKKASNIYKIPLYKIHKFLKFYTLNNVTEKSQMSILIDFKTVYKYKTLVLYFKSWRKISSH